MPWSPLPNVAFAVCIHPFHATSPEDLPLQLGDDIYIVEQGGSQREWLRGYLVAPPSLLAGLTSTQGQALEARVFSGIFPRNCVEVRELLGENKTNGQRRELGRHQARNASLSQSTEQENGSTGILPRSKSGKYDARRLSRHVSRKRSTSQVSKSHILRDAPAEVQSRPPGVAKPPAPVPLLRIGDETPTFIEEPLVDEISSCLREWHSTKLHELLLARRYFVLDKISDLVIQLDTSRRQLLHEVLTAKELEEMRETAVWNLVAGNKLLDSDVIVRSPSDKGRILTAEDSPVEISRLQSTMSLLDRPSATLPDVHNLRHILVDIRDFAIEDEQPVTVHMYVCSKQRGDKPRPMSEVYAVETPLPDVDPNAEPHDRARTLFADLSAADVGEGAGAGSNLYLVFKLLRNLPYRSSISASNNHPPPDHHTNQPNGLKSNAGSVKGRRSLMFGSQRGRKSSYSEDRPRTGSRSRSKLRKRSNARSSPSSSEPPPSGEQGYTKRVVGLGTIDIGALVRKEGEDEYAVAIWTPVTAIEDSDDTTEGFDDILKELVRSPTGNFVRAHSIRHFDVFVKAFAHPSSESLIKSTPTHLHNILSTRKLGFSGAPTQPRSDIYLTICEPHLPRSVQLSHPKTGSIAFPPGSMPNMQLTLEVRNAAGGRIEGCIHPSANGVGHTAWRTAAVEKGEAWNTTLRLSIEPSEVPGSHIVMSIADAPALPFALSWIPLWENDAFIRDGDHSLALYTYDEYTSSMIDGKGAYLALPWNADKRPDVTGAQLAHLQVHTYLCSTEYSQDPDLLGLLNWRRQHSTELVALLKRFAFVPEIEIAKLLKQVFDALFEVLDEYAGNEDYEDLVFADLVTVLGIVHDRRFHAAPLVVQYAQGRVHWPHATSCLLRSFQRLLSSNPLDPENSRKLRATVKVGHHLLKLLVNAQQQQHVNGTGEEQSSSQPSFIRDLNNIFVSMMALMRNSLPVLIGTKTLVVQRLHDWLPELTVMMSNSEIFEVARDLLDSCSDAQGKLIFYRLILIINISQLEMFRTQETQRALASNTARWLAPYWGNVDMVTEQWRDQVRLCCSAVAAQRDMLDQEAYDYTPKLVESYCAIKAVRPSPKTTFSPLFPTSYPFPVKPVSTPAVFDEALVEIAALLASKFSFSTAISLGLEQRDLADFLYDALQAYKSILDCEAFPRSWLSLHIFQHKSTMQTLERIWNILTESLLPDANEAHELNTDLWRTFFDTLLTLVGSEALAMETFPEQKRRAVWKIAGDVRELGADLLRKSWNAIGWEADPDDKKLYEIERLGGYQVQYVPSLIAPVVELCLSPHENLRRVAIELLRSMIVSEWNLSQNLEVIQTGMIDCLDALCRNKNITETVLQKLFVGELLDLFEPLRHAEDDSLFHAVRAMISKIDELLGLLTAVHNAETPTEVSRILDTLRLMTFLKDMQKEDTYVRYVHQLADLQVNSRHYTEAGLALQLHADLYPWDPNLDLEPSTEPSYPAQTAFERREALYLQIIGYFEEGGARERVLSAYSELANQYEHNVFDIAKLARTQRAIASIYESVLKDEKQGPRYFRVTYKGLGFPINLRDKQFIFEGLSTDRLATFTDRLQQQYPSAQILQPGSGEDLEGQYLQIFPVSPMKELSHTIYQRPRIPQPVREYFLLSRPNRFTTTTRRHASRDESVTEQLVDKTVYTTLETFPTILRRSEIVGTQKVTLTPLQAAVERTTRKTQEICLLERRILNGEDSAISALSELLMISVAPESDSSVSQYRSLLPSSPAEEVGSDAESFVPTEEKPLDPLQNALKVALLDHALAIQRSLALHSRPAHLATRSDLAQRFAITFAPELDILSPPKEASIEPSPASSWVRKSMPSHAADPAVSSQATSGAQVDSAVVGSRPASPEKRTGRRLSISFLKRGSFRSRSRDSQVSGALNDGSGKRRTATSRDRSTTRRRSFLRLIGDDDANGLESRENGSNNERPGSRATEHSSGGVTGSIRKRLSLIGSN
ncbi:Deoxycytidine kinase 1 [Elasticomyces elasticus]|nr:Deoxycytidine kinase 1 [Elasticomyces elasticus]